MSVLRAVRVRHNELQRIETTLAELASIFQDLAVIIEQQEQAVLSADEDAESVVGNLQQAEKEMNITKKHLLNIRRNKWWCLLISILIFLVCVAIVLIVLKVTMPWLFEKR